jgi:hypothetical protein
MHSASPAAPAAQARQVWLSAPQIGSVAASVHSLEVTQSGPSGGSMHVLATWSDAA